MSSPTVNTTAVPVQFMKAQLRAEAAVEPDPVPTGEVKT